MFMPLHNGVPYGEPLNLGGASRQLLPWHDVGRSDWFNGMSTLLPFASTQQHLWAIRHLIVAYNHLGGGAK